MNPRTIKDIYVDVKSTDPDLTFDVRFHDNCQKRYKFSKYEVSARRCSERDFIESIIRDYYDDLGESSVTLNICFS